jgi:hypothetical protein
MVRCVLCTRSKKIQFCAFEFYTFFKIFINFKKSTLWHFNSFFCIFGPDKATRQGLSIAIRIVKDEDTFLVSFPHLTLVSPHLWYFTIYVVLSSQNDVGILFFSVYLKSKILHCFHFYFDIKYKLMSLYSRSIFVFNDKIVLKMASLRKVVSVLRE